ncbi:exopolysaccharide biosynthesis protein [Paenibacillus shirakamiensis]|uniref:Exopolysaccharide biosynthesis protein n=2 Tax=Paenibacillus shirakamiensis TaxID=1265935 RepID=A0ABS4JM66_9BACL|nr:exopolysaccharide biosynthesis protein [Paenibacillus shirakamiensis]
MQIHWKPEAIVLEPTNMELQQKLKTTSETLSVAEGAAKYTTATIRKTAMLYQQTNETFTHVVHASSSVAAKPELIYNRRIVQQIGLSPIEIVQSNKIRIELYKFNPGDYRAYAMKIKLKEPSAMKMALEGTVPGTAVTTMQAVQHTGAVAGINAGGFADMGGKRYPLSTTIQNGKYINGFEPSFKDLSFVGINETGQLIGGKFSSQSQLDSLKPSFGATFVPVLIQNGMKTKIPDQWITSPYRAPRTIIGNYKDDQLLVVVVDGYNENGSSGASLPELQDKLYNLGVYNAYNLDGGGSASLILNGRVVNTPSDGALRPVPTHFLFFK